MIERLRDWFLTHRRPFPWRRNPTPYSIWVSEVMLQQTQASVVIPYFQRWMAQYPTLEGLAAAPIDEVVKLWEGLGYCSRHPRLLRGRAAPLLVRFRPLHAYGP